MFGDNSYNIFLWLPRANDNNHAVSHPHGRAVKCIVYTEEWLYIRGSHCTKLTWALMYLFLNLHIKDQSWSDSDHCMPVSNHYSVLFCMILIPENDGTEQIWILHLRYSMSSIYISIYYSWVTRFWRAWWRHDMETLSALRPFQGILPVTCRFRPQKTRHAERWAIICCKLENSWRNCRTSGDLRRHDTHVTLSYCELTINFLRRYKHWETWKQKYHHARYSEFTHCGFGYYMAKYTWVNIGLGNGFLPEVIIWTNADLWHRVITLANANLSSKIFYGILTAISQDVLMLLINDICSAIAL